MEKQADKSGSIELNAEDLALRVSLALVYTNFYKQDRIIDFDAEMDENVFEIINIIASMSNPLLNLSVFFPILRPIMLWLANNVHPQARLRTKIIEFIKSQMRMHHQAEQAIKQAKLAGKQINEDSLMLTNGQRFRRNMMDYITDQFQAGKLSPREYLHSSFQLFFAANKTTSDALAKTLYLLAAHQSVQGKLRKKVQNEGSGGEYLDRVIFETLRLYPPALVGCSRVLSADEHTSDGHLVPAGTIVITCAQTIHRLREYWGDDADEFKPERWEKSNEFHPCQYIAFGAGKRACPGKELAIYEIRLFLEEFLTKFKLEQSPKAQGELAYQAPHLFVIHSEELAYVKISRLNE